MFKDPSMVLYPLPCYLAFEVALYYGPVRARK